MHRLQLFQTWQQLERIGHDDPAVVLTAPASKRSPWGDSWRFELMTLVSFHSCHTLRKQNISAKPPTHHHDRYVHVTGDSFVTNGSARIARLISSICTNVVVSPLVRHSSPLSSEKSIFQEKQKNSHCVTVYRDWILRDSLSETFLMMCRSTSAISL